MAEFCELLVLSFNILLVFSQLCGTFETSGPVVTTHRGNIIGKYQKSRNGNQYETFLGIQYGKVFQRFAESVPIGNWTETKDATKFGPSCAQESFGGLSVLGEEDCLFLNVFTPKADNTKRGVLFFIHGGGFLIGSSVEYGGGYLVDEDIVLVTANYRLGVLGFLNKQKGGANGNMGLKDQVLALKWVHENIEFFGGDPNRITISGHSAGSASASYLLISPLARGLFNGMYGISGSLLNSYAFTEDPSVDIEGISNRLNCSSGTAEALVECFRKEPLQSLLLAQRPHIWLLQSQPNTPSIEIKGSQNMNPFLDKHPLDIILAGRFPKVPVLLTMTKDEGFSVAPYIARTERLVQDLDQRFEELAPTIFAYGRDTNFLKCQNPKQITQKIFKFYFQNRKLTREIEESISMLITDSWNTKGIYKMAKLLANFTTVYTGLMSRSGTGFSSANAFGIYDDIGNHVGHGDDLAYVFEPTGENPLNFTSVAKITDAKDIAFSKKMVHLVGEFVKTGVPRVHFEHAPKWNPVSQAEVDDKDIKWFSLEEHPKLINPFKKRMEFWDSLYRNCASVSHYEEL